MHPMGASVVGMTKPEYAPSHMAEVDTNYPSFLRRVCLKLGSFFVHEPFASCHNAFVL